MLIGTAQGIYTKELCADSKKYLSRLLIGKININPKFLTWNLLLTNEFNMNALIGAYQQVISKQAIENELIELECQNAKKEFFKTKKKQSDRYHKKCGLIALSLLIKLSVFYFYFLPLLGTAALVVGALGLAMGLSFISFIVIQFFVGRNVINPKWHTEYTDLRQKKIRKEITLKIKGDSEAETQQATNSLEMLVSNELTSNLTTSDDTHPYKKNYRLCCQFFSIFKPKKIIEDIPFTTRQKLI